MRILSGSLLGLDRIVWSGRSHPPRRPCFAWPDCRSIASTARRGHVHGGLSRPLEKIALARGFTCSQCRMHGRVVRACPSAQPRLPMRDRRDERGRAAGQPPLSPDPARGAPAQALVARHTQRRGQAQLSRPLLGRIHVSLQPPDFLVARNAVRCLRERAVAVEPVLGAQLQAAARAKASGRPGSTVLAGGTAALDEALDERAGAQVPESGELLESFAATIRQRGTG